MLFLIDQEQTRSCRKKSVRRLLRYAGQWVNQNNILKSLPSCIFSWASIITYRYIFKALAASVVLVIWTTSPSEPFSPTRLPDPCNDGSGIVRISSHNANLPVRKLGSVTSANASCISAAATSSFYNNLGDFWGIPPCF